eukprot:356868-Chlamydomonas_euryale.AAC.5
MQIGCAHLGCCTGAQGHAERAAINTPIQGSAADVAAAAMVAIAKCPELRRLGWKLLMQVHDEVILEGPRGPVTDKHPKVGSTILAWPVLFQASGT